jgi:hypothetical protein
LSLHDVVIPVTAAEIRRLASTPLDLAKDAVDYVENLVHHPGELLTEALAYAVQHEADKRTSTKAALALLENRGTVESVARQFLTNPTQTLHTVDQWAVGAAAKYADRKIAELPQAAEQWALKEALGEDTGALASSMINFIVTAMKVVTLLTEIQEAQDFKKRFGRALNAPSNKKFYLNVDDYVRNVQILIPTQSPVLSGSGASTRTGASATSTGILGGFRDVPNVASSADTKPELVPTTVAAWDVKAWIYWAATRP